MLFIRLRDILVKIPVLLQDCLNHCAFIGIAHHEKSSLTRTLPGTLQVATPMPFRFSLISEGTDEIMQDILYKEEKVS